MPDKPPFHVSILGAGSSYGVYLVKWAYQLLRDPSGNREGLSLPPIGSISYSNTNERNVGLVQEVLLDDLHRMAGFEDETAEDVKSQVRGYTRWRDMVTQEKPDLVVVGSPTETHLSICRELITGFGVKNILCESPLTPFEDADGLPGLMKLVEEHKVTFGVNFQYASLTPMMKDQVLHPEEDQDDNKFYFRELMDRTAGAEVTFITHGTRLWRRFSSIDERVLLEDLGAHALYFLPPALRQQPVTVRKVTREGDNLFLTLVQYDLSFGKTPVRMVLGYRRKLKSLKVVFTVADKDYEFHLSGVRNPETGEFTRRVEGKNHAFPFKHDLPTDLVKYSFMRSIVGDPLVTLEETIRNQSTLRTIYAASQNTPAGKKK